MDAGRRDGDVGKGRKLSKVAVKIKAELLRLYLAFSSTNIIEGH